MSTRCSSLQTPLSTPVVQLKIEMLGAFSYPPSPLCSLGCSLALGLFPSLAHLIGRWAQSSVFHNEIPRGASRSMKSRGGGAHNRVEEFMVDGLSDPLAEETCGIFHISTLSSLPPSPPPTKLHLLRTIASSTLSTLHRPANYHLLSINQIRGVFNPLLQRFPGGEEGAAGEVELLTGREEVSVGRQKSKGCL